MLIWFTKTPAVFRRFPPSFSPTNNNNDNNQFFQRTRILSLFSTSQNGSSREDLANNSRVAGNSFSARALWAPRSNPPYRIVGYTEDAWYMWGPLHFFYHNSIVTGPKQRGTFIVLQVVGPTSVDIIIILCSLWTGSVFCTYT